MNSADIAIKRQYTLVLPSLRHRLPVSDEICGISMNFCIFIVCVFVGTLAVSLSFPLIFLRCFACTDGDGMWGHLLYYSPFIAIFQFGWASTQIAHMALMSQLTQDRSQQTELNGLRFVDSGFTYSHVLLLQCYT